MERNAGGERGIRTPGRGVSPYNGLANRRLQPLGHLSVLSLHGLYPKPPSRIFWERAEASEINAAFLKESRTRGLLEPLAENRAIWPSDSHRVQKRPCSL